MGMLTAIAKVFGGPKTPKDQTEETVVVQWDQNVEVKPDAGVSAGGDAGDQSRPQRRRGVLGGDASPVQIDLTHDDDALDEPPVEVVKSELVKVEEVRKVVAEDLRDSYDRSIALAEKVDRHLDTQDQRSRRLLEIAEQLPDALAAIGNISAGQEDLRKTVTDLASAIRDGHTSTQQSLTAQIDAIGRVEGLITAATEGQRDIKAALDNLAISFHEITESNQRLGETLTDIRIRDAEREERTQEANAKMSRLLTWVIAICGVGVLAIVATLIVVLVMQSGAMGSAGS
ncbi:MAG TPA: hypothetical protein ENJ00_12005 [Phycisphaerales bacterium]|nr:hypothetical protein [Phycisphaerales bacterium]